MSDEANRDDGYEVGRGKPPKEHRFRKGQSGNPKGRPPNKSIKEIDPLRMLEEAVPVRVNGRRKRMPRFEVGVRQLVNKALTRQDAHAAIRFVRLCERHKLVMRAAGEQYGGVVVQSREEWDAQQAEQVKKRDMVLKRLREEGKI